MAALTSKLLQGYGDPALDRAMRDMAEVLNELQTQFFGQRQVVNDTEEAPDFAIVGNQGATVERRGQGLDGRVSMQLQRHAAPFPSTEGGVGSRDVVRLELETRVVPAVIIDATNAAEGEYEVYVVGRSPVITLNTTTGYPEPTTLAALISQARANPELYESVAVSANVYGNLEPQMAAGDVCWVVMAQQNQVAVNFRKHGQADAEAVTAKSEGEIEYLIWRVCCETGEAPPEEGGGDPPPPPG